MPINGKVNAGAGDFEPVAAGPHIAVCDIVADLGMQPGSALYPRPKQKVLIRFELPGERVEFERDGKKQSGPAVISQIYTLSMNEKANLRHTLEGWRGRAFSDDEAEKFDVASILGKPCMINVVHNKKGDKTYSNISSISGIPKGMNKTILPEMTPIYYAADDISKYAILPDWIKKIIDGQIIEQKQDPDPASVDPGGEAPPGYAYDGTEISDDDIPF